MDIGEEGRPVPDKILQEYKTQVKPRRRSEVWPKYGKGFVARPLLSAEKPSSWNWKVKWQDKIPVVIGRGQ